MKKLLSIMLLLCMVLALLPPLSVSAEDATQYDSAVLKPYAVNNENFYRTYLAKGDSVDISYSYSTGSTGGGHRAYLFRTYLSGNETQEQLETKAKSLLRSNAWGTLLSGGWIYSAPTGHTLMETIDSDEYGVGTYLFVCAAFDTKENYYYDSVCAIAIHIVWNPVPLTGIEYYWGDENGENLQKFEPGSSFTIEMGKGPRYLHVRLLPQNTTCRLDRMDGVVTNREDSYEHFLFTTPKGNYSFAISAQYCGEGYVQAVIDSGDPNNPIYKPAFNAKVPCKPRETPEVIKEATCTEKGLFGYACEHYWVCGTVFSPETIPAAGHNWVIGYMLKEPTQEETGSVQYYCRSCYKNRQEVVPTIDTPPEKPYKIVNVVNGVHVYWNAVNGARKYGVWRSETGKDGSYKWLGNPTVNHFTDTTAESGKTYYYRITVLHTPTNTHSNRSEALGITFVSTPDITARYNKAAGVKLEWQKISGASGYAIYRKSYSGNDAWVRVATISGNATFTWTDTSVKNNNGTAYKYTIRALAGADMKTLSGCRNTGRSMVRLASRILNSVEAAGDDGIKCSWSTSSAVTGYEVRFMVGDQVYKTFTVGNCKTGTKTFTGLPAGQTYKIQVRSYVKIDGMGFYSAWSAAKTVTL